MMPQYMNPNQRQSKVPLLTILGILLLIALSVYFFTLWPFRGLILFLVFPLAVVLGTIFYYKKRE